MEGMQRALALTAAAVVATLCLAAAPALSLKPYRPEPVDFSMAGDGVLGSPAAADGIVSRPLRAPKRFNLVGLTWDEQPAHGEAAAQASAHDEPADAGPALAVRTRTDGGDWTPWKAVYTHAEDGPDPGTDEARAAGMSNPVWAGEADWVQYRSSERLRDPRLHFVNTAGTATEADRVETALRGAVSTAVTSVAGVVRAKLAGAQEPQPAIVPRADWGADACPPRSGAVYGQVKAAYVHHTVNLNDYTREEAPQVVLGICRYHRNTNGWNDVGYNFLVDRFGTIYEGRAGGVAAAVIGAQAEGFNAQSTGIANIGTFSSVPQSQAALDAMARLIRWKLPLHGYSTSGTAVMQSAGGGTSRFAAGATVRVNRILGHRDTNATECPGAALYAQIPQLRQMAGGVAPQGVATSVTAAVDAPGATIDYGQTVSVAGRLTRVDGADAAGQPVQVQTRVDGSWRTSSAPLTAADGSFAATVKPKLTRQLRVRFAGAGELRSSVTPTTTVAVRPVVTLTRPPRRGAAGVRVDLRGRVQPRKASVHQVLQRLRGGRYRKVGAKPLPTRRGGYFSGSFVPARPGVFRYYLATKADALNARGGSDKVVIRVGERARALRGGAQER